MGYAKKRTVSIVLYCGIAQFALLLHAICYDVSHSTASSDRRLSACPRGHGRYHAAPRLSGDRSSHGTGGVVERPSPYPRRLGASPVRQRHSACPRCSAQRLRTIHVRSNERIRFRSSNSLPTRPRSVVHAVSVQNNPPEGFWHFSPERLGIFSPNFTRLLDVPIYARLQIFIHLSPTVTNLCRIGLLSATTHHAFRPMVDILIIWCELGGRAYKVADNWIKIVNLAWIRTCNRPRRVKFGLKIPNCVRSHEVDDRVIKI